MWVCVRTVPCTCGSQWPALLECRGLNSVGKGVPVNCKPDVIIEWDSQAQLERDYLAPKPAFSLVSDDVYHFLNHSFLLCTIINVESDWDVSLTTTLCPTPITACPSFCSENTFWADCGNLRSHQCALLPLIAFVCSSLLFKGRWCI